MNRGQHSLHSLHNKECLVFAQDTAAVHPTTFTNPAVNEERNTCKISIEGLTHQYTMSYMYSSC